MHRATATPLPRLRPALCCCSCILRGDERIALVMTSRVLLSPWADLKQLVRSFLDAPASLRRHHAPDKVCQASIRTTLLCQRRTLDAAIIIGPAALSFQPAVIAGGFEAKHGGRVVRFGRSDKAKGFERFSLIGQTMRFPPALALPMTFPVCS